jgi:phosphatidylglycerol---prolipoprotein diacylglyceryl transferase
VVRDFFQTAVILVPGVVRLGPLRLPVYGVCAAVGLVAGLWLSLKTARLVGLAADQVWDAGLFGVMAAFVLSRLLLIGGDVRGFLRLPVVMLALPSFTVGGMVLTAVAVVVYLRWKRLALVRVLDAWAPCAAVVAAMLSLGRFFEGADWGMPTRLPWGTVVPGSARLVHLQPVAVYGVIASVVLLVVLMVLLGRGLRGGVVAGVALVSGGAVSFLIDMVTQPVEMRAGAWLEPVQWVAVGAMLVGGLMLLYRPPAELTREEAAVILENFVLGGGGPYDHEILEFGPLTDPLLLEIRARFTGLQSEFPPNAGERSYCNEQGREVLLAYARQLRASESNTKEIA